MCLTFGCVFYVKIVVLWLSLVGWFLWLACFGLYEICAQTMRSFFLPLCFNLWIFHGFDVFAIDLCLFHQKSDVRIGQVFEVSSKVIIQIFFLEKSFFFDQPKLSHKIFNCFSKENAQKKLHFRCFAQDFHVNCLFSELPISNKNSYQMLLYVNAFAVLYLLSFINWFFFTSCKIQSYISRTFIQNVRFFLTTFS